MCSATGYQRTTYRCTSPLPEVFTLNERRLRSSSLILAEGRDGPCKTICPFGSKALAFIFKESKSDGIRAMLLLCVVIPTSRRRRKGCPKQKVTPHQSSLLSSFDGCMDAREERNDSRKTHLGFKRNVEYLEGQLSYSSVEKKNEHLKNDKRDRLWHSFKNKYEVSRGWILHMKGDKFAFEIRLLVGIFINFKHEHC